MSRNRGPGTAPEYVELFTAHDATDAGGVPAAYCSVVSPYGLDSVEFGCALGQVPRVRIRRHRVSASG